MRRLGVVVAAIALLAACGSDDGGTGSSTTTRDRPPSSRSSSTTASTSGSSSTTSSTAPCPSPGATTDVKVAFPDRMSSLVGRDVRTGAHPCFDRFVIELGPAAPGPGFPGYFVRYVPKPISLSPSDLPVTIRGSVVLMVSIGSWMNGPENQGYQGPQDVFPTNVSTILEYRLTEDFEGMSTWALGLDRNRPFLVSTLADPPRLVVDISTT